MQVTNHSNNIRNMKEELLEAIYGTVERLEQKVDELSASPKYAGAETVPASNDTTKLEKSIIAMFGKEEEVRGKISKLRDAIVVFVDLIKAELGKNEQRSKLLVDAVKQMRQENDVSSKALQDKLEVMNNSPQKKLVTHRFEPTSKYVLLFIGGLALSLVLSIWGNLTQWREHQDWEEADLKYRALKMVLSADDPNILYIEKMSGITPSVAKNIVAYREENGAFTDRRQLKKVPKLGPKAYLNAAGFLRISGGKNPLDATSVHPESYEVATAVLERAGVAASELSRGGVPDIERRLGSISALASDLDCRTLTLIDIVNELKKPGRDPRDDAPEVVFSRSALSINDLEPGMELKGTVRNVVDFGAFVDVGVHQDGLVHISKLANRFVKHPSDVVHVGDTVKVWVEKVDRDRKKISLTMVQGK